MDLDILVCVTELSVPKTTSLPLLSKTLAFNELKSVELKHQGEIKAIGSSGKEYSTYMPWSDPVLVDKMIANNIDVKVQEPEKRNLLISILASWLPFIVLIFIWFYVMRNMMGGKGGGGAFSFGKSKAKLLSEDQVKVTLKGANLGILINNAGTNIALGPLTDLSPEQFDKMFQVNLRGPWYLASRIAPIMAAIGGGSIINILSVAALRPPAYNGFYAATKSGLEVMTKVMAQEWANDKIRVNAIAPGPYRSDLVDSSIAAIPGFEEGMRDSTLLKRIAETEEILKPVFYLASDGNITGTTLIADGGLTAN